MKIKEKNEGITLIALIITIILMLILASVSISMIVNDEIFDYAGQAVEETEKAKNDEQELVNTAINDYIKPNLKVTGHDGETFSKIYTKTAEYTDTEGNTAVIPKGFAVGTSSGINKISTGLVISDANGNEFVWIPVTEDLDNYYEWDIYGEPVELDEIPDEEGDEGVSSEREIIAKYYGDKFNYEKDFNYQTEYEEMVAQVNKYDGFYIGRYETTIDENGNIGSKYNTKVLTTEDKFVYKGTEYYYRWFGLYYFAKNANITGNGNSVQTAMICGTLREKMVECIIANDSKYTRDKTVNGWPLNDEIKNSGQSNKNTLDATVEVEDVYLNIWDLLANAYELTQMAGGTSRMGSRCSVASGIDFENGVSSDNPLVPSEYDSTRLILYIK